MAELYKAAARGKSTGIRTALSVLACSLQMTTMTTLGLVLDDLSDVRVIYWDTFHYWQ